MRPRNAHPGSGRMLGPKERRLYLNVAELFGQLQQGQLALGTLCGRGHRSSPCSWFVWSLTNLPETPVPALNQADCRIITKPLQTTKQTTANGRYRVRAPGRHAVRTRPCAARELVVPIDPGAHRACMVAGRSALSGSARGVMEGLGAEATDQTDKLVETGAGDVLSLPARRHHTVHRELGLQPFVTRGP